MDTWTVPYRCFAYCVTKCFLQDSLTSELRPLLEVFREKRCTPFVRAGSMIVLSLHFLFGWLFNHRSMITIDFLLDHRRMHIHDIIDTKIWERFAECVLKLYQYDNQMQASPKDLCHHFVFMEFEGITIENTTFAWATRDCIDNDHAFQSSLLY